VKCGLPSAGRHQSHAQPPVTGEHGDERHLRPMSTVMNSIIHENINS
jgi:hypothetical protein